VSAPSAPRVADFRSDTVTRPTDVMRRAMAEAEVGDDVFGDDPTVNALEREAARLFGKEAGLFLPSGTMANLVAFLVWCRPGEEAIVEERAHSVLSEQGGAARFGGVQLRTVAGPGGALPLETVAGMIRGGPAASPVERLHGARTALVCVENTHNFHGGRVVPLENVRALGDLCRARGVRLHMDGARIFNAVVASGVEPREWAAPCDSLTFCVSKGLSAPAGSVLVGSRAFIEEARRARKALGGGMRQAGVLAAAGLVALREMVGRLVQDHHNARLLADGLAKIARVEIDASAVETNIVFFRLRRDGPDEHAALAARLKERGVLCSALGALGVRFVTHREVTREDVLRALEEVRRALA
jgi:threonine aldolase